MFGRDPFEKMLKKAEKHLNKEEYVEAKDTYLKCFALEPGNAGVLNNLAQLYGMLGDNEKSNGYNKILLDECDNQLKEGANESILMFKANALVSLKRLDELNDTLDELLKIAPNNIVGLFQKAHYLEITGQNEKAIEYIDKVLTENPYNISALLSKGRNLVELDEFEKAEECYNLVLKIETKNMTAVNLKSKLLKKKLNASITPHDFMIKALERWEMNDFDSSATFFKKAINLNPDYDEIWFAQGELFIRMGRINDAIDSFKKAFELNSSSGGIVKHEEFFKLLNRMRWVNRILGHEK